MFLLILHLSLLLLQCLSLSCLRHNFMLKFLDLVIKHKLELIEFLDLFSKLLNLLIFVCDGELTFMQFILKTLNDTLFSVGVLDLLLQLGVLLCDLGVKFPLLRVFEMLLVLDQLKITSLLHTLINLSCQLFLISFFDLLNFLPSLILYFLSIGLMVFDHSVDSLREELLLSLEFSLLNLLVSGKILKQLLLININLTHCGIIFLSVQFLGLLEFIISILVSLLLLILIVLSVVHLFSMGLNHGLLVFLMLSFHFSPISLYLVHSLLALHSFLIHIS